MKDRFTAAMVLALIVCGAVSAQNGPNGPAIAPNAIPTIAPFYISIPKGQVTPGPNSVNPACPGSATAPHCAILTWTAPTAHTDGTAITGALTYDVLRGTVTNGVAGSFASVLSGISGASAEDDSVVGGQTYEYEIVAHEAANSNPSAASTASVALLIPQAPPLAPPAPTVTGH